MTEPSQYFKGRTVQEQMNEVIGYVDVRAEEVAAAKADDVLEPAEQAKTDAIAAKEAAEDARDATLAALPTVQSEIDALDGRMDTVELKVTTAEGNIVTIQGQITALQTADGQNVKINNVNQYAVGLTGNQDNILGNKGFKGGIYNGMVKRVWNGYPTPEINWVEVFRYNTTTDVYLNIEFYDTSSHYIHAIGECNSTTPNLFIVSTAGTPTGYGVAIAQENGDTIVYIKTARGRNHSVTVTAHDRFRNPLAFTPTSGIDSYRETLPAISANVIA